MNETSAKLHVMHILEGTAGGARKHLRYIVTRLREQGVEIDLVLSTRLADPDFADDLALYGALGCQVHLVDMHKKLAPSDLRPLRHLQAILAERRPDIVHTHCAKAGFLGRLAAWRALPHCKRVHTPHSYFFEGFRSCIATRLGIGLERWLNRRTDLLFCISEAERRLIETHQLMPPERVMVGPNGLPDSFYDSLVPRDEVRRDMGIAGDIVAVGVFARMVRKKGHFWFLDAVAAMHPQVRQEMRVLFFGDGPLVDEIKRRIERLNLGETVIYLGYKPAAERLLPGMDLAVLPSFYEGLSYQLLEALGAGLPLIATDIPGNRFTHDHNPIIYVEPGNVEALARQLTALVRTEKVRIGLGAQSRAWVCRHFGFEDQATKLLRAYHALLDE